MSHHTSTLGQGQERPTSRARHPRVLIAVMITAALMDMLDVTIVNVALPTIRGRLHAGPSELEWVVAGYALAFAATLVLWGRVGDVFGRRRVFLVAVAVFGLASLGAGLSGTSAELIAARIVEGAAAGALVPQVLATFRASLDDKTRLTAFGVYGAVAGLAAAVGVILGGVLTQYSLFGLSWRAVFLVNVPVCLIVLTAATVYVPESRAAGSRLDLSGGIVSATASSSLAGSCLPPAPSLSPSPPGPTPAPPACGHCSPAWPSPAPGWDCSSSRSSTSSSLPSRPAQPEAPQAPSAPPSRSAAPSASPSSAPSSSPTPVRISTTPSPSPPPSPPAPMASPPYSAWPSPRLPSKTKTSSRRGNE